MWKDSEGRPILYYHESTSNMIKAMVHVFRNVYVTRYDKNGSEYAYRVPVRWAGKENYVQVQQTSLEQSKTINEKLPAMALLMPYPPQIDVDSGRQTNPDLEHCVQICPGKVASLRSGTPMKFAFELCIRSKQQHELFQIYEQIITRLHRPIVFISALETNLKIRRDIPITITEASWNLYENEFVNGGNSRPLEASILFSTSGYFYPPIIEQGTIKNIVIDYKNLCATDPENTSFVKNTWSVNPSTAEESDQHDEVLVQNLFNQNYTIKTITVEGD